MPLYRGSRRLVLYRRVAAAAPTGYQGPGDLTSGALIWGGLRAYNAAYAAPGTNNCIDIVDQAGAHALTVPIHTDGYVKASAIASWVATNSVTTIRITRIYDQTGGGAHFDQVTVGQMPALVLSPTGLTTGRYGIFFTSARSDQISSSLANLTTAQPFTISALANRTTRQVSVRGGIASITGASVRFGYSSNAGTVYQYAGTALNDFGSVTDNAWHGFQSVYNGASSLVNIDGSNVSDPSTPGATALSSTNLIWSQTGGGDGMDGYINELGIWSGSVAAGMGANQLASL
jgi:hypothetical protein